MEHVEIEGIALKFRHMNGAENTVPTTNELSVRLKLLQICQQAWRFKNVYDKMKQEYAFSIVVISPSKNPRHVDNEFIIVDAFCAQDQKVGDMHKDLK